MKSATATWSALGTTALVRVADAEALRGATKLLDRQLRELDQAASRFRDDSELTLLNRRAGSWTDVSPLLGELLAHGIRAAEITDGALDPVVGWAVIHAGYDRDFEQLPAEPRVSRAVSARLDWRALELSPDCSRVRTAPGVRIDLGATAKAFAADRAAAEIAGATGSSTLVSLGGDVATAGEAPTGGWRVRVTDDHRASLSAPGQTVTIHGGALATSSTSVRRWRADGRVRHHIIDPRTGEPAADSWRTVSATAATCVDANIASTAAIVLGAEAPEWLEHAGIAARLVASGGQVTTVCGWPGGSS